MQSTSPSGDGSLKLRGLLLQSAELVRQRKLEQAFTNAQIVKEFALRSGEAPEVAYRAQLLMARIRTQQGRAALDADAFREARRILEALAAQGPPFGLDALADELDLHFADLDRVGSESLPELRDRAHHARQIYRTLLAAPNLAPDVRSGALVGLAELLCRVAPTGLEAIVALREEALRQPAILHTRDSKGRQRQGGLAARLLLAEARLHTAAGRLPQGIEGAQEALGLAKAAEDVGLIAAAECLLGRLSRLRDNTAIALRFLYSALDTAELTEDRRLGLEVHLEIALAYQAIHNDREADKHFAEVATAAGRHGLDRMLYRATLALGCAAQRTHQLEMASHWLGKALMAAQREGSVSRQATVLAELADVHCAGHNYTLARHYHTAAVQRFDESRLTSPHESPPPVSAKTHMVAACLRLEEASYEEALQIAQQAAEAGVAEHRPEIVVAALRVQGRAREALGQLREAMLAERRASTYLVELIDRKRERQLTDLDMRAALREREREIEKLTRENDLKSTLLSKNEEIERANADLLQANEELRQFAFVASHDLKEPLRQIGSYVSLLKRKYGQTFDEDGQAYLGFVTEGVSRLNRLFDSLMHYTTVARVDKELGDVDLNRLFGAVQQEFAASIRASRATLHCAHLPKVQTGGKLLRHVLSALIDNALRFRRPDVAPVINVFAEVHEDGYCIAVQDNGIGILQDYQDKVFQLFQMLHAKSEYPGTGVGLAIAQKTVQRLGGRIWYEDNADGSPGVTFRFTLPMAVERSLPGAGLVHLTEEAA